MSSTSKILKGLAVFIAFMFMMPLVPALYIGNVPQSANASIDGNALPGLKARAGEVKVGDTTTQAATSANPQRHVVRGNNNYIYTVYESNAQIWFSRSTDNGQTFSTPKNVSNDTLVTPQHGSYVPAIACNGTAIFVVWAYQDLDNFNQEWVAFRKSNDNGTTWIPPLNLPGTKLPNPTLTQRRTNPAIAVNNTTVYVVATNFNNDDVYLYMSLDSGTSWNPALWGVGNTELLLNNNAGDPTISVSKENVYITYTQWGGGGAQDISYIFSKKGRTIGYTVADFSLSVILYQANSGSRYSSVVASGTNVYVAWQESPAGGDEIYFRNTTNNGTSWSPAIGALPTIISNSAGNARNPSLTLGSTSLFCTWRDSAVHASYDVVFSEWANNVWDTPLYITDNTNTAAWPSAAEKVANNKLDVVWTNGTNPYVVLYNGLYVAGSAPVLNWTGEANYILDGVNPDTGTTGHTYTFRVMYTDADNEAPLAGFPKLFIDRDLNGGYTGLNEQVTMTAVDNTDNTYSDGKLYTYSTKLKSVGTYKYHFAASDTNGRLARGDPTHDINGPVITSINEPPQLDWVQDWGYINDGLDPNLGFPDTNFTFKVVYTDILNESPAMTYPKLYIDMDGNGNFTDPADQAVSMLQVSVLDTTFSDGKIYYYNTTFSMGAYKYKFYAEDMVALSAETPVKEGPIVTGKGIPPVLSPVGTIGFVADGVDPDFGTDTTMFAFEVKYTDVDGDMPATGYPTIKIDINRDGNYSANEKFVMDELNASDMNTKDGKTYAYSKVFPVLGLYKYEFYAVDTNGSTSNVLMYPGPNVNSTNKAPKLGWLGSGGFSSDGLDPEIGSANGTVFHYNVIYSDSDGDAPIAGNPKVWIDLNLDDLETSNEWFPMTDATPGITDFHNEKKYEYNTTLALAGTYSYRFAASDIKGAPAPSSNAPTKVQNGPIVSVPPDLAPRLELLNTTAYNATGVSPALGDLETLFVYKVRYVDAENDLPDTDFPRVYIDADGDSSYSGQYDIVGVMIPEDAQDTNVVDGKVYVFSTLLPIEGTNYAYKFKADDLGHVAATGLGSIYDLVFKGPTVKINREPLLQFVGTAGFANDGVEPDTALENSLFTFRVLYKDVEGDKPKDGKVYLRIDLDHNKHIDATDPKIAMTEAIPVDQNYADGKEYMATYTFTEDATYGYRFEAQDAFDNMASGPAALDYLPGPITTEPIPNRLPTLSFTGEFNFETDGVNPLSDLKGATFTFRVRYSDLDNDAVSAGFPKVTIGAQSYEMKQADSFDTNFVDGKIYTVDVILSKASTYTYTFDVKNSLNQTASLGPVEGPIVTVKAKTNAGQMVPDLMWLILLIVVAIVVAIIGYLVGARRKKQPQPHYREAPRSRAPPRRDDRELRHVDMVPLSSAEVKDDEPEKDEEPEKEEEPVNEMVYNPGGRKEPEAPITAAEAAAGAKADLKADSDQPATTGEDATKPEEKPGPPVMAAETKPDLKDHKADSEAPASDKDSKEPETEDKKDKPAEENKENVDEEIDSILAKLEK